jgi:hypothetical protein
MKKDGTRSPRRAIKLLAGAGLGVVALAMIVAGAFAAVARSAGTYVDLGAHGSYRTDRYALTTRSTNWRSELFGWAGSVRVRVASTSGKPIFAGVAAADAVTDYLSGRGYTMVSDRSRTDHTGSAPALPDRAIDWTARARGTGVQTLRWHATERPQTVVAMNADGSRPVRVRVVSSEVTLDRMPWWLPAGVLVLGIILLPPGVIVSRRTIRAR